MSAKRGWDRRRKGGRRPGYAPLAEELRKMPEEASRMFVSLDGLDGAGKSTQCRRLADWLRGQGHDVVECADPGGTHVGQALRTLVLDKHHPLCLPAEAFLFMASRAQLVDEVIRPAIAAGKTIVSDRYLLANVVYQGHAGGLDPQLLWTVGRLAIGDLLPDLTIVLDVPLDQSRGRRKKDPDRMELRGDDFFAKVRAGFLAEAKRDPERIVVIDAGRSADEVHDEVVRTVGVRMSRGR